MKIALPSAPSGMRSYGIPDYIGIDAETSDRLIGTGPDINVIVKSLINIRVAQAQAAGIKFHVLSKRWKNDIEYSSSVSEMVEHEAYQEIIRLGWIVVPFLLRDLRSDPDHWFVALSRITGIDPVKPEDRGNMRAMANAWLEWGSNNGYID